MATLADGRPIVAKMRIEYGDFEGFTRPLEGSANFRSYEPADLDPSHAVLTVRNTGSGARTPIASDRWAFGRCAKGQASLVPTTTDICLFDGFKIERLYELVYSAKDPLVMGLGYAVTRDVASFLRYQTHDDAGNPNPLASDASSVGITRAYQYGVSSTGMYSRDFYYLGFNEDEAHRKVFDAALLIIPGTHRLFANVEFADPNVYSRQDIWHDSLSYSYPPLTYAVTTDPISGIRDGILKRPATDPLVFQVDSANEFWQMQGSLNVVDGQGRPVPIPDNVRLYFGVELPAWRWNRPTEPSWRAAHVPKPDAGPQLVGHSPGAPRRARCVGRSGHRAAREQLSHAPGQHARLLECGPGGVSGDPRSELPNGDQRAEPPKLRPRLRIDGRTPHTVAPGVGFVELSTLCSET